MLVISISLSTCDTYPLKKPAVYNIARAGKGYSPMAFKNIVCRESYVSCNESNFYSHSVLCVKTCEASSTTVAHCGKNKNTTPQYVFTYICMSYSLEEEDHIRVTVLACAYLRFIVCLMTSSKMLLVDTVSVMPFGRHTI